MLRPSQAFVFCHYKILVAARSPRASLCECDGPDNSSFGQNIRGDKDWGKNPQTHLSLYAGTSSAVKDLFWHPRTDE